MTASLPFTKACALENDFIIIDGQSLKENIDLRNLSLLLANRRQGIGCDQVIYIFQTNNKDVYKICFFNADGSEAESCGNGSRCVAKLLMLQNNQKEIELQTWGGNLKCQLLDNGDVSIGFPLPFYKEIVTLPFYLIPSITRAIYVNIGNPHLVCFVKEDVPFGKWGPLLETYLFEIDPIHPERVNVGFAQVIDESTLKLDVWERGVGHTHACGTGACAAAFAAYTQELTGNSVEINQFGGCLKVKIDDQTLFLEGKGQLIFKGEFLLR